MYSYYCCLICLLLSLAVVFTTFECSIFEMEDNQVHPTVFTPRPLRLETPRPSFTHLVTWKQMPSTEHFGSGIQILFGFGSQKDKIPRIFLFDLLPTTKAT